MAGIIREITDAGNEESAGIAQINKAIIQMDDVTQQNAALVEQAAAAAQSLQERSEHLSQCRVFRLGDEGGQAPGRMLASLVASRFAHPGKRALLPS